MTCSISAVFFVTNELRSCTNTPSFGCSCNEDWKLNLARTHRIIATFQHFCEIGTVDNRQCSGRSSKATEEKIGKVLHVTENQQQTNV